MPSILSSFTSQASFKLLSLGTGQYLPQINVIKSKIRLPSKLMKHMSEDGSTIIDARIIEPAEVEVQVLITTQDQFMALNNVLNDRGAFYTIITKGLRLIGFVLDEESLSQSPAVISANPISLKFRQVLFSGLPQVTIYAQPADSSVLDLGFSALSSATSTISNLYSKVGSMFGLS